MDKKRTMMATHPKGEMKKDERPGGKVVIETYEGRVHIEWKPEAAVTTMGQLAYFIEFLKTADLFEPWVNEAPLRYQSPNAPSPRDVLGTVLLSILSGHHRYAHINTIRCDTVNPSLLGMKQVVSEDSVRRGFRSCDTKESAQWLKSHLQRCYRPLLEEPWILDVDTTVKTLYGHQQGAMVGYNPHKPCRPSHTYHTYMMAATRLIFDVEARDGNQTASCYTQPGIMDFLDSLPRSAWPRLIRGDCNFGNEAMMSSAEERGLPYLFKLRQSVNVKRLVGQVFCQSKWIDAGQGWHGVESTLRLQGWSKTRRVVVLRRQLKEGVGVLKKTKQQLQFAQLIDDSAIQKHEYAVLVTSLPYELFSIAQLYRDRADIENVFDEMKNQWCWSGFTTKDMNRCQIMARIAALVYNWWSLFARLAIPSKHAEAITSRPLLLNAVGKRTLHQGQTKITITGFHAKSRVVQKVLNNISRFLEHMRTAEQLTWNQRWRKILSRIFVRFLDGRDLHTPPLLPENA